MQSTMKPNPHSVRTAYQGMDDVSGHDRSYPFGQTCLDMKCETKKNTSTEKVGPFKSSEQNVRKSWSGNTRTCDDDNELVKYMSNLPGFLQQMEKKTNIQEKALNFGVLDWKRLEKWKYTERLSGKYPSQETSSSSKARTGQDSKKQPPSSHVRNSNSLYSGKQAVCFGSPQSTQHSESRTAESIGTSRLRDDFRQRVKFFDEMNVCKKGKDPMKKMVSEKEASQSEQVRQKFSFPSNNNNSDVLWKMRETRFDDVELLSECNPSKPENVVLLKPEYSQESSSECPQFTDSRSSLDEQLAEITGNRLSDFFCPNNSVNPQGIDSNVHTSASESKCSSVLHEETARSSSFLETSDEKQAEISEFLTPNERASSPTPRFSFNLGRVSRSLSFKDNNSALPQLSSTYTSVKSGPARPEISSSTDNFKRDRANACGRARSSPLRRLLDPLLKHRGAHAAEIVSKGPSHDRKPEALLKPRGAHTSETVSKGVSQDRKPEGSATLQALLQLSLKNGLPSFKLVVNNTNNMLAAAVKRLPMSGEKDSCMIYSFYSVHEIRKKNMNWMNQGSKSKSCGLGYNIVGEMKISSSSECDDVRECVLYGVDPGQVDKQTLEYLPNEEIAAVIVRNSTNVINDGELSDMSQLYKEREFSRCASAMEREDNKDSSGIVVILPGGVHGIPITGEPSSLISRWRFGGSCDCGGWDVGCKLRVFAGGKKGNSLQASMSTSTFDQFNLFLEGGERKKKPVFSLKPCSNGYYSIEFDASISLLEAFAICVAHVTCSKFPEITDAISPSGSERLPEAIVGSDKRKTPTTFQEQLPAYVTCPPLSPAGRI